MNDFRRFHPLIAIILMCLAGLAGLVVAGCASRPQAPIVQTPAGLAADVISTQLDTLLPADVLILGEQHDIAEHQQIEQQVIALLASRGALAAVALEMADVGTSTATLKPRSTEEQAQQALRWDDKGWPWAAYGPAVMAAVRAGIPVLGANLPRAQMQGSMADSKLDAQLAEPALKAQQQSIRIGHCNLLPESQIAPMTRIQIAKDITMANALAQAALPGKTVVLLAGSGHANRQLGVPQHLPANLQTKSIRLLAGQPSSGQDAAGRAGFDSVWTTKAGTDTDYCAGLENQLKTKP